MDDTVTKKIEGIIQSAKVVLFMRGTPAQPYCGFSGRAVELLRTLDIAFESFNVDSDEEIWNGIKEYGNWPTFPQLYIAGKLIGGSDIMADMAEAGELQKLVAG